MYKRQLQCNLTVASGRAERKMRILFGDIWFCEGQSNMQFRMGQVKDSKAEMSKGMYLQIKLIGDKRDIRKLDQDRVKY